MTTPNFQNRTLFHGDNPDILHGIGHGTLGDDHDLRPL